MIYFPYNPQFLEKIKTINGHRWNSDEKYLGFPNSNGILEEILEVFEGDKIYIDPALKNEPSAKNSKAKVIDEKD